MLVCDFPKPCARYVYGCACVCLSLSIAKFSFFFLSLFLSLLDLFSFFFSSCSILREDVMGQSASNIQSTLTLAYVIPAEEKQRGREDIQQRPAAVSAARREDVLLSHPEHYALTDTATPSSTSTRRADSGYGEDFHGEKVGQDIAYIDEKYYNPTQKDNSKDYNKKCGNSSRTSLLTFSDVKLDNSLYDINLSARRLIKLSSNISHFATLRRLDL